MKDEINGSDQGGDGRRLARGNWSAMQGMRRRAAPPRRDALPMLRAGEASAAATPPYSLLSVYHVLSRWQACDRSPLEQYAYDIALGRVIERMMKDGATAPRFDSEAEVYAYARCIRGTALIDAHRHMEVVDRHRRSIVRASGLRINDVPVGLPPGVADEQTGWDQERAEQHEWLVSRVGSEAAELVERVHLDDETVAGISRESREPESTIRSRLSRATARVRTCLESEDGVRACYSQN